MCYPQPTGAGVEEMMSLVRAADVFAGKHPQQEQQEDIPQEMWSVKSKKSGQWWQTLVGYLNRLNLVQGLDQSEPLNK